MRESAVFKDLLVIKAPQEKLVKKANKATLEPKDPLVQQARKALLALKELKEPMVYKEHEDQEENQVLEAPPVKQDPRAILETPDPKGKKEI